MNHRIRGCLAIASVMAVVVSGCGSKDSPPNEPNSQSDSSSVLRIKDKGVTAKGGTVYVLKAADFDSIDPANNYVTDGTALGRLIYRTLTFVKDTPGEQPSIQPDLAESLGTPSADKKTWTYKLREGLKYEDGAPITAQDVKYGVQRSFASDVYTLGATFLADLLENPTEYKGPYASPAKDLTSVETPDDRTLVFHFKGPQPDADWVMSLFYTSPIPKGKDTRQEYGNRPIASGPYKIDQYTRDSLLTLVRNEQWDAATDPNRPAYPDRFEFSLNVDKQAANQRLIKGDGKDANAVTITPTLLPSELAGVLNSPASSRLVNGSTPCVNYLGMNTQKIKDVDVRHAVALAINREGIATINGGEVFGSIASSIIPSEVPGFVAPDLGLNPKGDPEAAKKLLAGKTLTPMHLVIGDTSTVSRAEAEQIQADLKAVGIDVIIDTVPSDALFSVVDGDDAPELADAGGWCFDWPTPASVVMPVFGPDSDGTKWGSNNQAKFFDPKLSGQIRDLASSSKSPAEVNAEFVKLANEIQTTAWPILPTLAINDPELVGGNVTNVGISPLLGSPDLITLAVKK